MSSNQNYKTEIDTLRALAVIAVIINHISEEWLPSGYLGVDVFFVISGYVVSSSISNTRYKSFKEMIQTFYSKRVKRLFPALYTVVLIFTFLSLLFVINNSDSIKTGMYSLLGLSNMFLLIHEFDYFAEGSSLNLFTHTWSLGVEEQFYIFFPIILYYLGYANNNKKVASNVSFKILLSLCLISLVGHINLYFYNQEASFYLMPSRFWQLGLGSIIYLFTSSKKISFINKTTSLIVYFLISSIFFIPEDFQLQATILISFLTATLLIFVKKDEVSSLLKNRYTVSIGKKSYSLYLWHWPLIVILKHTLGLNSITIPLMLLTMFVVSTLSYNLIENKFRNRNWGSSHTVLKKGITSSIVIFFLLLISYKVIENKIFFGEIISPPKFNTYFPNKINSSSCNKNRNDNAKKNKLFSFCKIDNDKERTLFIYGDSYAQQLIDFIEENSNKFQFNIKFAATSACPLYDLTQKTPFCQNRLNQFLKLVDKNYEVGDKIIIATSMKYYSKFKSKELEKLKKEILKVLNPISNLEVFFTEPIPVLKTLPYLCQQPWSFLRNDCDFEQNYNQKESKIRLQIFEKLTSNFKKLNFHNTIEKKLKTSSNYSTYYYDNDHLSATGSILVKPEFKQFFIKTN